MISKKLKQKIRERAEREGIAFTKARKAVEAERLLSLFIDDPHQARSEREIAKLRSDDEQ